MSYSVFTIAFDNNTTNVEQAVLILKTQNLNLNADNL